MGRLALRPALRAYAHAPPAVETAAPYSNAYSVAFDGSNDYARATSSPIDVTGAFSVSLWAKVGTPQAGGSESFFSLSDSSNWYRRLVIDKFKSGSGASERAAFRVATTDGVGGSSSSRNIFSGYGDENIGKWRHVVVTCSATSSASGTQYIYLDGVQGTSGSSTMVQLGVGASIDDCIIGAHRHTGNGGIYKWLDGNVDEISCWNRVLSQSEITALYNSGTPTDINNTSGVTPDAVAWYRMGDAAGGSGTSIADQIGSVDLTLFNGPTFSTDVPT